MTVFISLVFGVLFGLVVAFFTYRLWSQKLQQTMQDQFQSISNQLMRENADDLLQKSKEELKQTREEVNKDMGHKEEIIERLVKDLRKEVEERQEEIRKLEKDRNLKFGAITEAIKKQHQISEKLQTSTEQLNKILSQKQIRGSWGERAAEDIFHFVGFMEGKHYLKQTQLGSSRPDFILLLPEDKKVSLDVKFPLDNLRRYIETQDKEVQSASLDKFKRDVKNKLKEVTRKDYISVDENTLDFVIVFIPSEAVYGFINKLIPNLIDEAFARKVILASPYSLYAIIKTVSQAHRNFFYEQNIRAIIKTIQNFIADFGRFQDEFANFGKRIQQLQEAYDQITGTRYRQLNLRFRRVKEFQKKEYKELDHKVSQLEGE